MSNNEMTALPVTIIWPYGGLTQRYAVHTDT